MIKFIPLTIAGLIALGLLTFTGSRPEAQSSPRSTVAPVQSYTVQGDSLSVMSRRQLKAALPGWRRRSFSAAVGRQYWTGLDLLSHQRLGRVVVFALGTNSWQSSVSAWRRSLRKLLRKIGPERCLVMATIYDQRPITSFNRVLRAEARRAGLDRFQLAGWAGLVSSGQVRLADGVHPARGQDVQAWARLLARSVKRCAPAD